MCFHHSVQARQLRQFWVGGDVNHFNDLNLSGVLRIHKRLASLFDFFPVSPVRHAWSLIALIPLSLPPLGTKSPRWDRPSPLFPPFAFSFFFFNAHLRKSLSWAELWHRFPKKAPLSLRRPWHATEPRGSCLSPWGKAVPQGPLFLPHLSRNKFRDCEVLPAF